MTNDYKNILLDYITGNLDVYPYEVNSPRFDSVVSIEKEDIIDELDTAFPYGYTQIGELKCKNSDGNYNGFTIVYGRYYKDSSSQTIQNQNGYILVFNENMDMVKILTEYNTGTKFNAFVILNIDEKGQLYGLDFPSVNGTNKVRFIMLNNISVKLPLEDYKAVLRQSYFIPDEYQAFSKIPLYDFIGKDVNSARYYMARTGFSGLELHVQVGASNEWTEYTSDTWSVSGIGRIRNMLPIWDNNGDLSITYFTTGSDTNDNNYIIKIYNEGTTLKCTSIKDVSTLFTDMRNVHYISTGGMWSSYKSYSEYTISDSVGYIMLGATGTTLLGDLVAKYKIFKVDNGVVSTIYTAQGEPDDYNVPMYCNLLNINNTMFANFYWNLETMSSHLVYDFKAVILLDDWYNDVALASTDAGMLDKFHLFDIRNVYNLYTAYYLGQDSDSSLIFLNKSNIIYNPSNSNGLPFIYYNSLTPQQILLYDSEGLIFARNLYDKVIYNNITESIVQIPNTMLNDTTISQEDLLGKTNYVLSTNSDEITKNIYETLYINIFNKLNVINRNDINNPIINHNGASKINKSINDDPNETEYNNSKIGKVRINYKNGNSYIKNIISCNITNNIADIQFQITIVSDILNIEIISNDEATTYQRIVDVEDYELGKTYLISQKCHVE